MSNHWTPAESAFLEAHKLYVREILSRDGPSDETALRLEAAKAAQTGEETE